jgi:hypothetical protein
LTLASGQQELHRLVALRADWRGGLSLIHGPSKRLPLRKNTKVKFGNQATAVFNWEGEVFGNKGDRRLKDAATESPLLFLQSVKLFTQFDLHLSDVVSGQPIGVFLRQAPTSVQLDLDCAFFLFPIHDQKIAHSEKGSNRIRTL